MKVRQRLLVNGEAVVPLAFTVRLALNSVGWARFTLPVGALSGLPAATRNEVPGLRGALAELYLGVGGREDYLVLVGAVTESRGSAEQERSVQARELCAALEFPAVYYLRNITAREVIAHIERRSRLRFILPSGAPYLDQPSPVFESKGTHVNALNKIGLLWSVPGSVWYQLPDGRVYWGQWNSGPFNKAPLPVDPRLILQEDETQKTLLLPCIPALRPGMVLDCRFRRRIEALTFEGDTVLLEWQRV